MIFNADLLLSKNVRIIDKTSESNVFLIFSFLKHSPVILKLVFDKSIYLCVTDGNLLTAVFSWRYWFKTEHFKDSEV